MKHWNCGDKSRAICERCRIVTTTTFGRHDVPFENGFGVASQIIAATCDECGTIVTIPPQSTPAIHAAKRLLDPGTA